MIPLRQVLDTTMPQPSPSLTFQWLVIILTGEILAFLITWLGCYALAEGKISFLKAAFISALATSASFSFGVLFWLTTGFW